ncbi:AMP-binding protein, partial [Aquimarina algiphila]|uniref:AMP-binding protein n=1 Tax=Aquimarina algiphila TaxID=2047982 RepID=UPI00232B91CD
MKTNESDDGLYVIYTSGSTGNPKGILIDHSNFYNYLTWASDYYFSSAEEGNFGLYSSLSFDLTMTSFFCPLIRGKKLKIYSSDLDISAIFLDYFDESSDLDFIKITPSHALLLERLNISNVGIHKVIIGGEKLQAKQVNILKDLDSSIHIYNEYGPTEATIGCVVYRLDDERLEIPIGRPISNTQVYILGSYDVLQPIGVV